VLLSHDSYLISVIMVMSKQIYQLAERTGEILQQGGCMMAAAESCTGGWLAKMVTDVPGSSQWFDRGYVTYSNQSKIDMLGVSSATLDSHGAVSLEVVAEMAEGALEKSQAGITIAISGIAGPDGGTKEKPIGTVCFAWAMKDGSIRTEQQQFFGNRSEIRQQAVVHALSGICEIITSRG
jgi:nicotinamide-nucleotide amidase